jgi:proteasome lid subunit RPN8/RPN11
VSRTDRLELPAPIAARVLDHARRELPNEACGLLSGRGSRATRYHPARNALASPYRYDLHPQDLVRIMFEIEAEGEELVAIFHSHTRSEAIPSATDVRSARYDVIHLLASLAADGGLRAWRLDGDAAIEVPIQLEEASPSSTSRPVEASSTTSRAGEPSSSPER